MRKAGLLGALQVCYYPIEIEGTLFYLNNMGNLCYGVHYGQSIDDIHITDNISENYTTISNSPKETIILRKNAIEAYSLGKLIRSWNIPDEWVENLQYCGYSYFSKFIFKNSNNVYAIDLNYADSDFYLLSSNVKKVIDTDYEYSIDAWCAPLFLMEDGSVKAYIEWDGKLYDLYNEGEWNDVHTPHIPYEYMN